MYFTDRGLEELEERRGEDQVTLGWLAERLREFIDLNPDAAAPVDAPGQLARAARRGPGRTRRRGTIRTSWPMRATRMTWRT